MVPREEREEKGAWARLVRWAPLDKRAQPESTAGQAHGVRQAVWGDQDAGDARVRQALLVLMVAVVWMLSGCAALSERTVHSALKDEWVFPAAWATLARRGTWVCLEREATLDSLECQGLWDQKDEGVLKAVTECVVRMESSGLQVLLEVVVRLEPTVLLEALVSLVLRVLRALRVPVRTRVLRGLLELKACMARLVWTALMVQSVVLEHQELVLQRLGIEHIYSFRNSTRPCRGVSW